MEIFVRIKRRVEDFGKRPKVVEETRSLWKTSVGGIVEKQKDGYYFIKVPSNWRNTFKEGDRMPAQWPLGEPISKIAREELMSVATAS